MEMDEIAFSMKIGWDFPVLTVEYVRLMLEIHETPVLWANSLQGGLWC